MDETLKELLIRKVPLNPADVDIKFEMPTRDWAASVSPSRPTINVFLYDLRENLELRNADRSVTRTGNTGEQRRAPVRIDLSYLITAWTADIADEHQLLGSILNALLRFPLLPADVLKGSMQDQPLPLRAWIALPERTPDPWDIWGHLEHRMKPGVSYVITACVEPHAPEDVRFATQTVFDIRTIEPHST